MRERLRRMHEGLETFFYNLMEYGCLPLVVTGSLLFAILIVVGCQRDRNARKEFMEQCLQEHKQYECTAMWRAGDKDIVPIPVVIPVR